MKCRTSGAFDCWALLLVFLTLHFKLSAPKISETQPDPTRATRSPSNYVEPIPNMPPPPPSRPKSLVLLEKDEWKVSLSGLIEVDTISDSTRSFNETIGNFPVNNQGVDGNGRLQFSLRNSRLALSLETPPVNLWQTRGYFEMDFLGYNPPPFNNAPANNPESAFDTSPTFRMRHAFLQGVHDSGFSILIGQTWNLLGWQPYYFFGTVEVQPLVGNLYGRNPQFRAMQVLHLDDNTHLQASLALVRPPQRDANFPDIQFGLRVAYEGRKSGLITHTSGSLAPLPMSLGVSSAYRRIAVPASPGSATLLSYPGSAWAIDSMIPLIATDDLETSSNSLSLSFEIATGQGFGDQFPGWTGNMANPLNTSAVSPSQYATLDAGIGDFDASGNFHLVNLSSLNAQLQYHFPSESRYWMTLGIGQLYSNNMNSLLPASGLTSGGSIPYNRLQIGFLNLFHAFTEQIRAGLEYAHTETSYGDGHVAFNNRYQVSVTFLF